MGDEAGRTVTSRRDALKLAGAATLGGVAAAAALPGTAGAASAPGITANTFAVLLDGATLSGVTDVETVSTAVGIDYGGAASPPSPGPTASMRIKITREWSNDTTFIDWYQSVAQGTGAFARRTVTIVLEDKGVERFDLVFTNCWPSGYDGPVLSRTKGAGSATETLTLVYENFDYKK